MNMGFFASLAHYLFPRYSNNHKAKILHSSTLLTFSFLLLAYQLILNVTPRVGVKVLGYAANISTSEVIRLTNIKRAEAGVGALRYNSLLSQAALAKGNHMLQYDYWAHVAPDGTEPWKFFTDVGYKYRYAGENLARDFTNPQSTVDAWMASPAHRENLLASKYVDIGVAVVEGDLSGVDTTIVVQLFGTPLSETTVSQVAAKALATATPKPKPSLAPTGIVEISPTSFIEAISTPSITPIEKPDGGAILTTLPPTETKASKFQFLISPFTTTRGIALLTTSVLLIVLIIDGIIVARKRITRIGGRTFAHFAFFGMILAILLLARAGKIL